MYMGAVSLTFARTIYTTSRASVCMADLPSHSVWYKNKAASETRLCCCVFITGAAIVNNDHKYINIHNVYFFPSQVMLSAWKRGVINAKLIMPACLIM